jgi:hypothetical protein
MVLKLSRALHHAVAPLVIGLIFLGAFAPIALAMQMVSGENKKA